MIGFTEWLVKTHVGMYSIHSLYPMHILNLSSTSHPTQQIMTIAWYPSLIDLIITIGGWRYIGHHAPVGIITRSVRRHSNLGGPQRLNRINLYGKKTNSYGEIIKSEGAMGPRFRRLYGTITCFVYY